MKTKQIKWLPRLLDKITNNETNNNAEFTYYGYHVTMLSGTLDYTDVTIQNKDNDIILQFTLDFLAKDCTIDCYDNYALRDSLAGTLHKLYNGRMHINDMPLNEELALLQSMLDNDEYDQYFVKQKHQELIKYKLK